MQGLLALGSSLPLLAPALTVYGLFYFFDRKASDPAKRAINGWINYAEYQAVDLRAAFVAAFDAVYSHPLLRIRAIFRSVAWSILVLFIVGTVVQGATATFRIMAIVVLTFYYGASLFKFVMMPFLGNLLSDYISIFLVRYLLRRLPQNRPFLTIFMSALAGCTVVSITFVFLNMIAFLGELEVVFHEPKIWLIPFIDFRFAIYASTALFKSGSFQGFGLICFIAGLVVHSWLLLFASGVVALRLLQGAARAARGARWFLARGNEHPLEAIGLVAAVITLASTVLYKLAAQN